MSVCETSARVWQDPLMTGSNRRRDCGDKSVDEIIEQPSHIRMQRKSRSRGGGCESKSNTRPELAESNEYQIQDQGWQNPLDIKYKTRVARIQCISNQTQALL